MFQALVESKHSTESLFYYNGGEKDLMAAKYRPPQMRYKREDVRVAGVTFDNDAVDGGENRQQILKSLMGIPTMVTLEHCVFHRESTGKDEKAIKVRSLVNRKVLGYIHKTEIDAFWGMKNMIAQVSCYGSKGQDIYSCSLVARENPSPKQYALVMALKQRGILRFDPFYDKTVYQYILDKYLPAASKQYAAATMNA